MNGTINIRGIQKKDIIKAWKKIKKEIEKSDITELTIEPLIEEFFISPGLPPEMMSKGFKKIKIIIKERYEQEKT